MYPSERAVGNRFEVDVEISVPDSFGSRDDLAATIDYARIASIVKEISDRTTYSILERLCGDICVAIFQLDDAIVETIVRVRKLDPPMPYGVNYVEVERRMVR